MKTKELLKNINKFNKIQKITRNTYKNNNYFKRNNKKNKQI